MITKTPSALRALIVAFAFGLTASAALAKERPKQGQTPSADIPKADKAGTWKVFGDGKRPAIHTPEQIVNGVWEKKAPLDREQNLIQVMMAYDDRAIAQTQRRVFENANPFTLKNNIYTFIVVENGTTSFGNPLDNWEVGTRHAHLSQGRPVVASGELVKSNGAMRLNMLSGTYMIPLVKDHRIDPLKMGQKIHYWFDRVLRQKYRAPDSFKVMFNQTGKGTFANENIFEVERAKNRPRLPIPTLCSVQKSNLCGAQFKFKTRNPDLCNKVAAARCASTK
jgi:hypothetical protein